MLNRKVEGWIIVSVIALLVVGVVVFFSNQKTMSVYPRKDVGKTETIKNQTDQINQPTKEGVIEIRIKADGIEPNKVVAKVGQIIKFVNEDSKRHVIEVDNGIWGPLELEPGSAVGVSLDGENVFIFKDKNYIDNPAFRGELRVIK